MSSQFFSRVKRSAVCSTLVVQMLAPAVSQADVVSEVRAQLRQIEGTKKASGTEGSFCYAVEGSAVRGIDQDQPMRIASVMKVLTTFWAVEALGPNYRFNTRLYVRPSTGEMHIVGGRDPFFDRDRLYTLIADLNKKGVSQFKRVTADSNFYIDYDATEFRYYQRSITRKIRGKIRTIVMGNSAGHDPKNPFYITEGHTAKSLAQQNVALKLMNGLNTKMWTSYMASRFDKSRSKNPLAQLPKSVSMSANQVDISDVNPLKGKSGVYVFDIKSAPLKTYLKKLNIDSINPMAEELFFAMGGTQKFKAFMQKYFGYGERVAGVLTGSGVNLRDPRRDTMVSCSTVVTMIRRMDQDLEKKYKLDLADVMMIAGLDPGTWGGAPAIVKTGTLSKGATVAKNLAGVIESKEGDVYFGIFLNGGRNANSGKVRALESTLMRTHHAQPIARKAFTFAPIDAETHMKLVGTIGVRR